jgi:CubicO group peptidase (beta-lactamase class C family)
MPKVDELEMAAGVGGILNRRPAVGFAVGVIRDGRLEFFHGHGVANIASNTPVTEDTVFRIGSITKTFTAIAIMQLCEQGLIDLDTTANDYLRTFQLISAKTDWRPASVRHLLTHTAGIPEVLHPLDVIRPLFGEIVKPGRPVPSLADYYQGSLPIRTEPGTRFTYTDHGFATLGQIIEDVSGQPFDGYLREHIFQPLGMADTDLVRSEPLRSRLATGYNLGSGGARAVTDYEVVTVGGGGAYSTTRDMARYIAALLGGGANEHGSVLMPTTLGRMFEPHYQTDPRVPGIGLAFDRGNTGGHRVIEHGGILPGFDSQLFIAPDDGVGVLAFTNGARRAMFWLPIEMGALLNGVLGVPDQSIRSDIPHRPELWADLCGWYQLSARLTDVRARMAAGAGAEVFVRGGRLMLRVLTPIPAVYSGFALHPDDENDPYAFRIDVSQFGLGTLRIVFTHEPGGGVMAVHLAEGKPLSAEKQPATTNPRRWAAGLLGALAVATTATAVRRRSRRDQGG